MKFEIDWNRELDDKSLEAIGAVHDCCDSGYNYYWIELNSFEELEELLIKVNKLKTTSGIIEYSAVVNFDPPTIYLDNEV